MKCLLTILWIVIGLTAVSCSKAGLQGTTLPSKFEGLSSAVAISPTTVKLSWSLQARFKEYRIYRKGFNTPVKVETFATTNITGLSPDTYYDFSVTGVDALTDEEFGFENFIPVKTMATFTGVPSSGLTAQANGTVEVNWVKNGDDVTYKVYTKRESETWDLSTPTATAIDKSTVGVTSLASGAKYCFWVMAHYEDETYEPTNMAEAYINTKAPCVLVQSQLTNLPTVKINSAFIGNFPWFWTEGGDTTYKTEVFERFTDIRLATVNGNDYFRSIIPISPGSKNMYAKVSDTTGKVTIVDVLLDGSSGITKPLIRSLDGAGAKAPIIPRLVGGGLGMQELGYNVSVGDFNCDGLKDVAMAAPRATPYVSERHYESGGAVVVYYGYDAPPGFDANGNPIDPAPTLKTDVSPSADNSFPNAQLIYYTGLSSNTRLGQRLSVGNVNGDCFSRYTDLADSKANRVGLCDDLFTPATPPANINKIKKIYTCDDLAIQTAEGSVFVVFGDPVKGLVTGSGGNSYGLNEATCDPTSFKCRPAKYKNSTTYNVESIVFGDYNNDGYDDLAMAVQLNTSVRQVHVLRGDRFGLLPVSNAKTHAIIDAESLALGDLTDGTFVGKSVTEDFGGAIGTAFNSRKCVNNGSWVFRTTPAPAEKGYDFTKCDDLVIGVPDRAAGRGSIIVCKGDMLDSGTDKQKILGWTCKESYPDVAGGGSPEATHINVLGYGASILGIPNQNGYPLTNIIGAVNTTPNISGAVFVGAPRSTVSGSTTAGAVFGYYMTPRSNDFTTGGILGILAPQQDITAVNRIACNARNTNVTTGALQHCENQVIHTSPAESGVQFGYSLGTMDDIESVSRGLPSFAVSAPYRTVASSDGKKQLMNHGVIYLYKPDVSALGYEGATRIDSPQLSDDDSLGCTTGCTWYSGGVNPFGASIIYAKDLTAGAMFGFGGAGGADFNGDGTGDLFTSAPFQSSPTYYNGAGFIFNSNGSFASSVSVPDKTLNVNFGKELNYHFERAKIIGDVNGDGYDDMAAHISVANTVELAIYYGSSSGLVTSPDPARSPAAVGEPLKLVVDLDPGFGKEFYRIGSVNGDAYDDILIIGYYGSYIYYGSSSGVVSGNAPSLAPVGQNPLKFAISGGSNTANFHTSGVMMGSSSISALNITNYGTSNRAATYGDFNKDGYSDFAIATNTTDEPAAGVIPVGIDFSNSNNGRIYVFYGSNIGPQTNRSNGTLRLDDGAGGAADVVVENPCTDTTPKVCKVQILASPDIGVMFGWSLTGLKSLDNLAGDETDELVVGDPQFNANKGRAYLFKGSNKGLVYTPLQKMDPATAGEKFGYDVVAPGDINGDTLTDLVVSGPASSKVYAFYGAQVGTVYAFYGAASILSSDFFASSPIGENTLHATGTQPKVQRIAPISLGALTATDYFGYGVAAVGDINNDSYADIVVNMTGKDYDLEEILEDTGAFVVYYGGPLGLKINATASPTPRCYGGSTPVCEPSLIYLPERVAFEGSYISSSASGDINGDGVADLLMAAPGRGHPSGKAFATGVVYVLY
ncbi:hypothetical protein [Bdellovibrio reynosensis]|uniref:Fibronectin type-III domain-containing protein n=1 Tax=Bdellovibrio reynosensis TaxID=2835041 RepID=A0ABY4C5G5_9BACT|nr:hypothetical protein [Bdellovibrio reynosensis]UOF00186.1 hypothetical protein MNR06_10780 [Bdellovibrio reynosensis]